MIKKLLVAVLVLGGVCASPADAGFRKIPGLTLLVVPRDETVIRTVQEMEQRRPVILVAYQRVGDGIRLIAWNGEIWVTVSEEDYVRGRFFTQAPAHTILLETEAAPAPGILIPDGEWCRSVHRLTSVEPRVVLHLLGRWFNLSFREWWEISHRFGYGVDETNPGLVNVPWWHRQGQDMRAARVQRVLHPDLEKWYTLELMPVEIVKPEPEIPVKRRAPLIPRGAGQAERTETTPAPEPDPVSPPVAEPVPARDVEPVERAPVDDPAISHDPFSVGEIPPADLLPPEPRKSFWKRWKFYR